jgi:hypothetical protein
MRKFLRSLKYPLYFLDFETFATAIPIFDEVRPYQIVPRQYSLHVVEAEGKEPKHHSFLADGISDPRPELLEGLKNLIGASGSIVAYNASFESRALRETVAVFSQYENGSRT